MLDLLLTYTKMFISGLLTPLTEAFYMAQVLSSRKISHGVASPQKLQFPPAYQSILNQSP